MGIMDIIKKFSERKKLKSEKFKKMQEDDRLNEMLEDRKRSSNERELIKYYKKQREEGIKKKLDVIHKKQTKENWKGDSLLKSDYNILQDDTSILNNDNPILTKKNVFLDNKTKIPLHKKELFFKW